MFGPNCRKLAKDCTKTKKKVEKFSLPKNLLLAIKIKENKEF
jgi:hypothetical protein